MRAITRLLVLPLVLLVLAPGAYADTRAYSGDALQVSTPVDGNLVLVGGTAHITSPVTGTVMIAAGDVEIDAPITGDVLIAGGNVRILSAVEGTVVVAGGNVELGPQGVATSFIVWGGNAKIEGRVQGELRAYAGTVIVNGSVGGNAEIRTPELRLGDAAVISGDLSYDGPDRATTELTPHVRGVVRQNATAPARTDNGPFGGLGRGVWVLGLLMSLCTALFLMLLAPALPAVALHRFHGNPLKSFFTGILAMLAVFPIILLMVTVVFIPTAAILLTAWAVLVSLTKIFLALVLGEALLRALRVRPTLFRRVVAVLITLFVLATLGSVVYVQAVVVFLLFPMALGSVILALPGVVRTDRALMPAGLAPVAVATPAVKRKAPAPKKKRKS